MAVVCLRSPTVSSQRGDDEAVTSLSIPAPALVVMVGAAGSGKSTWAAGRFLPHQIVSSDALRAAVGDGEHDMAASADAIALLLTIVRHRLRRRLTAVVDAVNLDPAERERWRAEATAAGVPCVALVVDTPPAETRRRNRQRTLRVPGAVLDGQLRRFAAAKAEIATEPFDLVHRVTPGNTVAVALVPSGLAVPPETSRPAAVASPPGGGVSAVASASGTMAARETTAVGGDDGRLRFGLQIPRFGWPGGPAEMGTRLAAIARAAEDVGFDQLWVMDHFRQIPMMGRAWDDMPESYTTLAYLAGVTSTIRLGTLVTGLPYRNLAHLAKIVATLDVMSGGRALCGLGLGWFKQEHEAYGWPFPSVKERYDLLRDALELLPLMWGPGTPRFEGRTVTVAEAMCYPRPLQPRIPILVGGSGERTTLRIVARSADACNLFGEPDAVVRKVAALHRHCAEVGRDPADIEITQLSTVLVGNDQAEVNALVERHRPSRTSAERFSAQVNAGTVEQHLARLERLRRAGVQRVIVSLHDLESAAQVERMAPLIAAWR